MEIEAFAKRLTDKLYKLEDYKTKLYRNKCKDNIYIQ